MPRSNETNEKAQQNPPQSKRMAYDFDIELMERVKQLSKKRSTAQKPVTISGLLDEAMRDLLRKYGVPNGDSPKIKPISK